MKFAWHIITNQAPFKKIFYVKTMTGCLKVWGRSLFQYCRYARLRYIHHRDQPPTHRIAIDTLDEFFDRIHIELYLAYRGQPEEHAKSTYLASYQYTVLQLTGHLPRYTQAHQVYSTPSHSTRTDKCCQHIHRALAGLLVYALQLAGGKIDRLLPVFKCTKK